MKKKTLIFLLSAVPLILIALYLSGERSPFGENNSAFASMPKDAITKVEFAVGDKRLVFEKKGEDWVLNGDIETRKNSIQFLLRVLTGIKIKSPVSPELFNLEIKEKGIEPVRVKVSENRKTLKTFLVYKTGSNIYGNIMKMGENSKPFIVHVPGYDGEIGSAFTLNEFYWQPHTVFNLLPSEILSATFENLEEPVSSFAIRNENGSFTLYDPVNIITGWDTARVIRYLTYFTRVSFESWAFGLSAHEKDKIDSTPPAFRITVLSSSGNRISLSLWKRLLHEDGIEKTDSDRLWAKTENNNEFFIIRYFDIDPLLKRRSYFFPEE